MTELPRANLSFQQGASRPDLSPEFCFNTSALKRRSISEFLRLSRTVDDTINQALNALNTPAASQFDPNSTKHWHAPSPQSQDLAPDACKTFQTQVLFPAWKARSDVLEYCALVAASPDPNDPAVQIREAEEAQNKERVINERLDPYSGRFFPTEPRTQALALLVKREKEVEKIIRHQTWDVVLRRCGRSAMSN